MHVRKCFAGVPGAFVLSDVLSVQDATEDLKLSVGARGLLV